MIYIRLENTNYADKCLHSAIPKWVNISREEKVAGAIVVWVDDVKTYLRLTRKGR